MSWGGSVDGEGVFVGPDFVSRGKVHGESFTGSFDDEADQCVFKR